jgi:hypothetical protein
MFAVKNNNTSFRAVASEEELLEDEYASEALPILYIIPKTIQELTAEAFTERDKLLTMAALRIAPLQDAVDLNKAAASDVVKLNIWKQYRVDVNRIDEQEDFPETVIWPYEPN